MNNPTIEHSCEVWILTERKFVRNVSGYALEGEINNTRIRNELNEFSLSRKNYEQQNLLDTPFWQKWYLIEFLDE